MSKTKTKKFYQSETQREMSEWRERRPDQPYDWEAEEADWFEQLIGHYEDSVD